MRFKAVNRIRLIALALILVVGLFGVRLFFIQVVKADYYHDLADRQYLRPSVGVFDRGSIFAIKKDNTIFSLAGIKIAYLVTVNPKLINDPENVYKQLSSVFPLEHEDFMKSVNKTNDSYEEIATKVDQKTADKIKALKIKGVTLYKQKIRSYPFGTTTAHVVGLLGYQGDTLSGRYGLERYYEKILSRQNELTFANFFVEIFAGFNYGLSPESGAEGQGSITTTIEPVVQELLEKELNNAYQQWGAASAGGIIIDPKTGEILAMAAVPSFNPGEKQTSIAALSNPLVESVREMGSVVKALTLAAGLDTGVVSPTTTYNDKGCLTLNNKTICNYDQRGRGVVSMQEVLNQSLNTGATFVEQKLGPKLFSQYFLSYGLGEKTGIDLPNEARSLIKNVNSQYDVDLATASFGQGIALTPISLVRALCSLANGGYLVQPHLVKKIDYQSKLTKDINYPLGRQVLKKETSETISRMLANVVDQAPVFKRIKTERYSIAAKTGTAQVIDPVTKKYSQSHFFHSFFGYFPADNPKFLVFLYLDNPVKANAASVSLIGPFADISHSLLNYYQVPPDR